MSTSLSSFSQPARSHRRSLHLTTSTLVVAVGVPLLVALAAPRAHTWLSDLRFLLVVVVLPALVVLIPFYRWLLRDEPLLAGWLHGVDPRLALGVMRTDLPPRALPLVTASLIVACLAIFPFVDDPWTYGFRPDERRDWIWSLWLSLWLHGDLAHLTGNLLFLWPMAAALEGRIPRGRLLALYLASGVAANLVSLADDFISSVGASGAISGLTGLFVVRCGFGNVAIGVPALVAPSLAFARVNVPAPLFAGFYFALDLSGALGARDDGTAYWAHVGGYLFGVGAALLLGLHRAAAHEQIERMALAAPDPDDPGRTASALDELLRLQPEHLDARIARARESSRGTPLPGAASDYESAIQLLLHRDREQAARLFVEHHRRHGAPLALADQLALTPALAALGEHDRAAQALAEAARDPDADPALVARALLQEGRLLEALSLPDAARSRYRELLDRYPKSAFAELATARLARLERDNHHASRLAAQAVEE
jgi:membrane associated rhomboid family serine protease